MADILMTALAEGIFFGFVIVGFVGTGIAIWHIAHLIQDWYYEHSRY